MDVVSLKISFMIFFFLFKSIKLFKIFNHSVEYFISVDFYRILWLRSPSGKLWTKSLSECSKREACDWRLSRLAGGVALVGVPTLHALPPVHQPLTPPASVWGHADTPSVGSVRRSLLQVADIFISYQVYTRRYHGFFFTSFFSLPTRSQEMISVRLWLIVKYLSVWNIS